nr:MAG TPA: hypothetical protein [Caudoviricetes sp.]
MKNNCQQKVRINLAKCQPMVQIVFIKRNTPCTQSSNSAKWRTASRTVCWPMPSKEYVPKK